MAFRHLINTPLEQVKKDYLNVLVQNGMQPQTEVIPVAEAAGRITALPVYAHISVPHYNASAMDGIALKAKLTAGASEDKPAILQQGQFRRVNTGAVLPEGCDAVIMIEDVTGHESGEIKLFAAATPWQHIRQAGEDICAGEIIMLSYSTVSPSALGAMIAGGVTEVTVIKRPVVGIIPTGSELVQPTAEPEDGKVPESNSAIFSAMLKGWGAETVTYPITKDDLGKIKSALKKALKECDIVILSAGTSVGSEDHAATAISEVGDVLCHGIAIKPGKPTVVGHAGSKPVLGVPGSPVSGIIVLEQLLRPVIEYLFRNPPESESYVSAILSKSIVSTPEYQEFVRVRMGYVGERLIASPLSRGSGVVTSFMKADGIVEVSQDAGGYETGGEVKVRLLRPEKQLRRSLVVIGSHDPLLDELAELLRTEYGDVSMGSAHVGSMGGLLAIRRAEAHVAGIHLLDTKTGGYNTSFIKKTLPKGGVRLVECVSRTQGIMVRKGNPLGINSVEDLSKHGLRYVNRQRGSGTRILIDYLCGKEGIDTKDIYGYDREEFTHTSVAALIASGSADAGMGVHSAAKLYDLDFVEVCREQYDLLIAEPAWESPMVQKLLAVLRSERFRERLENLGGYIAENPGTVREIF